ncbi:MAG: YdcF family protein, partial [Moorea sp. SIO3E2]|nr:YdcF family protein [Moorena sp. SIO3E2]
MSFPIAKIRLNKLWLVLLPMGLFFLSIIPLRLAIARHQAPEPQAILVLGGNKDRFKFTAQFSQSHPELDIWVSDYPSNFEHNRQIFRKV